MLKLLLILFPLILSASEDFISHYEYGQMLYNNPRGVSCAECHGKKGEGKLIIAYKNDEGEREELRGTDIRQQKLPHMVKTLNAFHKIMPRYYLTDEEVKAIYDYIQKANM